MTTRTTFNIEDRCSQAMWPFASLTLLHTSGKHCHSSVVASYACWSCSIFSPLLSWWHQQLFPPYPCQTREAPDMAIRT